MPELSPEIRRAMHQRLEAAGVSDARGSKLSLRRRRYPVVIGLVCDEEPLLASAVTLGRLMPDRLVRGLGAAALLVDAHRAILAVDATVPDLHQRLLREIDGSTMELRALVPRYPMDPLSLRLDLAQEAGQGLLSAGLDRALVLDVRTLCSMAAALEGRPHLRQLVSVAGTCAEPGVLQVPLGTSIYELVQHCGGARTLSWVSYRNGLLGGGRVSPQSVVDLGTHGVVVLPHDHPRPRRETTPLEDQLRRIVAACVSCRTCTDICPVYLNGGHHRPHLLMQTLATSWRGAAGDPSPTTLGSLECMQCGLCTPYCPAMLQPSAVVAFVATRLRQEGVSLAEDFSPRPHPDRLGRRVTVQRLTERLGLRAVQRDLSLKSGQLIPERIILPLTGPLGSTRIPTVSPHERVSIGDLIALVPPGSDEPDLRSPVTGMVLSIDPDDGVMIQPR